ncbi:MAG: DUF86 domain-containing protein [Chloroflexi bacterium]|nr:DUF86 domain-containing protein [Chloroflexota bacterium]
MKKDDTVYLHHILDAIDLIEEYTSEMSENEFFSNSMAHDAAIRQIEIIGEAASNVSDDFQEAHKEIPWGKMIGIRNKIIHEYFNINYAIIWDTIKEDLPILKETIKNIL